MFLDYLDPIDRELILNQEFENIEINYLMEQIKVNKITNFLDIGANCGYYSLTLAKKIANVSVIAFEPNKEAYFKFSKSLEKNLVLSKKIKLNNYGLSNVTKKLEMRTLVKFGYVQTGGAGVANNKEIKAGVTNNKKMKNYITFFADFKIGDDCISFTEKKLSLKIDVEGYELYVLEGLKKTLEKNKCILQIEIFEINFKSVNNLLVSLGFRIVFEVKERSNYFYINF